jgi:hypothetical protein
LKTIGSQISGAIPPACIRPFINSLFDIQTHIEMLDDWEGSPQNPQKYRMRYIVLALISRHA